MNKLYLALGVGLGVFLLAEHFQNATHAAPSAAKPKPAGGGAIPPAGDKPLPAAPRQTALASSMAQYADWNVFDAAMLQTSADLIGAFPSVPRGSYVLTNGADAAEPGFQGTAETFLVAQLAAGRRVFLNMTPIWTQEPDEGAFIVLLDSAPANYIEVVAG